ncbi:hypothetical protein ISN45_Aa08g006220 [Arabidopsis thaliana x Arabidopsis arenosa]|uniref:Uncharacterized protein n=1 Tax=Arabidopsis thaliana x Arabidopsis arenosa TaxID=1240361 RepID=A0A8T1XEM5_9BRAS|nr:hypothetical protein ISN45_Aa08g006220 [Arabidopsis thaliana x Arabidopsis arenosa]
MSEAHASKFSIHPRAFKMSQDLKRYYHWIVMKKDVASWVVACDIKDAIWVIVNRLTKSAHFLAITKTDGAKVLAKSVLEDVQAEMGTNVHLSFVQKTLEKIKVFKLYMKEAQNRQKSYADKKRRDLEFEVGDRVYLNMAMLRGPNRSITENKLSPRYMGRFRIVERVGPVAYWLELPEIMQIFHKVFHVSMLKKCLHKDDKILAKISTDFQPNMTLETRPVRVFERKVRQDHRKKTPMIKVLWDCDGVEEKTWDPEARMKARFKKWFEKQAEA